MERGAEIIWCNVKAEVHPLRIVGKALLLFTLVNFIYAWAEPAPSRFSAYNLIFPGRVRLPFGESLDPYIVMIDNVDAMLATHAISKPKTATEFRVVLIGDSSVWGETLSPQDSISEQWNGLNNHCGDRVIKVYNLGYPHPSVIKDLLILEEAVEHDPDLIVWFTTLNTLIPRRISTFLAANRDDVLRLLDEYDMSFIEKDALIKIEPTFYDRTLMGQRSYLNRWVKLQLLGFVWSATETDINMGDVAENFETNSPDVENDLLYRRLEPIPDLKKQMLLDALAAGHEIAGSVPILIVNEPMFIASGENKDIRYNEGYPRWAYDQYREAMLEESLRAQWNYLDLWNRIPPEYFSDTPLHLSAEGERLLIEQIDPALQSVACQ